MNASENDRKATQEFEVRNIITTHCGQRLTPDLVDAITNELLFAMRCGACSWAFKAPPETP